MEEQDLNTAAMLGQEDVENDELKIDVIFNEIKAKLSDLEKDHVKGFTKDNAAARRRGRVLTLDVEKLLKQYRKTSLETEKAAV